MPRLAPRSRLATHTVTNQPPDFVGYDLFAEDTALCEAVTREGGDTLVGPLSRLGREAGSAEMRTLAQQANRNPPELRTFDRWGRRIDEVEFHPSYHALMERAHRHRIAAVGWDGNPGSHVAHAAGLAVFSQVEQGTMCPMSMTYAAVAVLDRCADVGAPWVSRVKASIYEPTLAPIEEKRGVTIGMAMTEKQGGSDLRATTTRAEPDGAGRHRLQGHKWFCSAPMSDAFLTLAQAPGGLSCFLVPRVTPDGVRNGIELMRLKDKLGNRSNASAEIEYNQADAVMLGEEGRGIATLIGMVHHTRLDTMASTLGIMRAALAEAAHHGAHRTAFGCRLVDQPAMRTVLTGLQLDYEAAAAMTCRIARAFDGADDGDRALARLGVGLGKFLLTTRAPGFVAECLQCLGGAGYVEESPLARLYREAPVNAIWEGSGNVIALDVARTLAREPAAGEALRAELEAAAGLHRGFDLAVSLVDEVLMRRDRTEGQARPQAETLATLFAASLLLRYAPSPIGSLYVDAQLRGRLDVGHALDDLATAKIMSRIGRFAV